MHECIKLLKISENGRFIIKEDGSPFFWLGDTAWELFHKLSREEAEEYLRNRAERRFNVIQAVALAEFEGLTTENAYGRLPLLKNNMGEYDPTMPDLSEDYSYWDHVDFIVDKAAELGLYIGFLPTWGDKYNLAWGKGPVVFNKDNAKVYGQWLGERYKDRNNIIWILGGDRPLQKAEHYDIVRAMAEGLAQGDGGRHIMTFHPPGGSSSSSFVHNEKWLSFNMIQSGHSHNLLNYKKVEEDYKLMPVKPVLDGEPCYEDHPIDFKPENGYFNNFHVRRAAYWGVFAGGFGHTYGHHSIWSMTTKPTDYFILTWKEAIDRPGGNQMQYLRNLIESRPFLDRVPDQSLLVNELPGLDHIRATRGKDYAFIYTPTGREIKINMGKISGDRVVAHWYDPRTGEASYIGEYDNKGIVSFIPPSDGDGNDWVLVLDDSSKAFGKPGTRM